MGGELILYFVLIAAWGFYAAAVVAIAIVVFNVVRKRAKPEVERVEDEATRVVGFATASPLVLRAAGGQAAPQVSGPRARDPLTSRYEVAVAGRDRSHFTVIVDATRTASGETTFQIACLTKVPAHERRPGDECAQDESLGSGSYFPEPTR